MIQGPTLHVAIPAMNEAENLPRTIDCLLNQTIQEVQIWVCVNQPNAWWNDPLKQPLCENNLQTLDYLTRLDLPNLHVLDHCSPQKGWQGKNTGVGQARKTIMDAINQVASDEDIMVSLDADTLVSNDYLASIRQNLSNHPQTIGLSVPYYHQLSGEESLDRAMLRYEIYMRHYAINMWIIGSPYSFTALGSAIALPVSAYRKIGGMTPKKSGEDFYLLQKLRKAGRLIHTNPCWVFPGTRFSDRVFFGTGPALIKGSQGNWSSYPVYDHNLFLQVKETYDLFPALYNEDLPTPMSAFLQEQLRCENIFQALRDNSKTTRQFVKACHHRIDALRVLQFLKSSQDLRNYSDEENLRNFFAVFFETYFPALEEFMADDQYAQRFEHNSLPHLKNIQHKLNDPLWQQDFLQYLVHLDFKSSGIDELNLIRNLQLCIEQGYQIMDCKYVTEP